MPRRARSAAHVAPPIPAPTTMASSLSLTKPTSVRQRAHGSPLDALFATGQHSCSSDLAGASLRDHLQPCSHPRVRGGLPDLLGYEYSFAVAQRKESSGFNTKRDPISDQARRPI
jgi:hypothetical protein